MISSHVESPIVESEHIYYSSDGEVVKRFVTRQKRNRGGFVISYTAKMVEFLEQTPQGSYVRLFLYIAQKQDYGTNGVFGYRATRAHLAKMLGLTRKTVYTALEYLKSHHLVNELRIDGSLEFMVNPSYVTIGSDRKARDREWLARWEYYYKKLESETTQRRGQQ